MLLTTSPPLALRHLCECHAANSNVRVLFHHLSEPIDEAYVCVTRIKNAGDMLTQSFPELIEDSLCYGSGDVDAHAYLTGEFGEATSGKRAMVGASCRRGGSIVMRADEDVVIDQYERLADGRITGVISDGTRIWFAPTAEEAGSVLSRDGRSYVLGAPSSVTVADANEPSVRRREWARQVRDASSAQAAVAGVLLCFAMGFGLGSHTLGAVAPPPPPSPPSTTTTAAMTVAPAFERASLTTGEQLARQQLRLEADRRDLRELEVTLRRDGVVVDEDMYAERVEAFRATLRAERPTTARDAQDMEARRAEEDRVLAFKASLDAELRATASRIEKLQLKIRQDEEGLREITRIVAERGVNARAVQLGVFPSGDERTAGNIRPGGARARAYADFSFIP